MQIRVRCNCEKGNCPEWAIFELQGVVETQPSFQGQLQNLEIGRLCRPSQVIVWTLDVSSIDGAYTFTLGYHELSGTKMPLKKPMLLMKKTQDKQAYDSTSCSHTGAELEVIGIIRHRILFKTRPKALISSMYLLLENLASRCILCMHDASMALPY
ncbi:Chromosome transmission fidelity protein [Nymphaea thermarum]|nr:Chromosome transmission fidelity protein [Nymphaea thermarum]